MELILTDLTANSGDNYSAYEYEMFADDLIEEEVAATMKSLVHKFAQRCAPSRNAMKIQRTYPAKFKAMVLCDFDNSKKSQRKLP